MNKKQKLTKAKVRRLLAEGRKLREEMRKSFEPLLRITAEQMQMRVR